MESEYPRRRGQRGARRGRDSFQRGSRYQRRPQYEEERTPPNIPKPRPPQFTTIKDLEPEQRGVTVRCIVSSQPKNVKEYYDRNANLVREFEVLVADATGSINLLVRGQESDYPLNKCLIVRNGLVNMVNHSFMRLEVNMWGKIDLNVENFTFSANTDQQNNVSLVEYELQG